MAMNWPQLVKPRACRSALCCLTAFSNPPRENNFNTCEKILHTFIRLSLLLLNWFFGGTQSSVSGGSASYPSQHPPLRPAVSPLIWTAMIGNSLPLELVLAEVERVAPTDSTVLVLGETGTGKELIASAIHHLSARCGRPFVKLNCAAIPFELLESELFGHEKVAFTGALSQKIGRFEMAHTGTLFLDEIGDIPLALQPKLLRVLQEQEFERLGSGKTHRINVRLIAATHRDLTEMVRRKEFRSDLYYRRNGNP